MSIKDRIRQLLLWKWRNVIVIALSVLAIVLTAASNDRALSEIQSYLDIPGRNFEIGDAVIEKPSNWLLLADKGKGNDQVRLFGMLPWWFSPDKEINPRNERYLLFRVLSDNQNKVVAFFETPHETNEKLKYISQHFNAVDAQSFCGLQIRHLHNYDALECRPVTKDSDYVIYIPEIQITISVKPYDPNFINSLLIKRKHLD